MRFQTFSKKTTLQGLHDASEEEDEDAYAEGEGEEEEEDELGSDPVVEMAGPSGSGKHMVGEKVEGREAEGETKEKEPAVPQNVAVAPGEGEIKPAEAPRAKSPALPAATLSMKSSY